MKKSIIFFVLLFAFVGTVNATALSGTIYNENLEQETDVLVEVNTIPAQKYLAKNGTYTFSLPIGNYVLTVQKREIVVTEYVNIAREGSFVLDIFLLPDFVDEDELWQDTEEQLFNNQEEKKENRDWAYWLAGIFVIFSLYRIYKARMKYGPLRRKKRKKNRKEEIVNESGCLERVLDILKRNDGRISQKDLRKKMLHLSEAKVSLIVTELEHKGLVEKIKKGRGNVILMK